MFEPDDYEYKSPKGEVKDQYTEWRRSAVLNDKLLIMEGLTREGASFSEIADYVGVTPKILTGLKNSYRDVSEALRKGADIVDFAVENALLKKALGGETQAITFWLKNRKPSKWNDRREINATIREGYVQFDFGKLDVEEKDGAEVTSKN